MTNLELKANVTNNTRKNWKSFYYSTLSQIVKSETISFEEKENGVEFLKLVDENMGNVLADLEKVSQHLSNMTYEQIMTIGVENIFGDDYEEKEGIYGREIGNIKKYNEFSHLSIDPYVVEGEMIVEYMASRRDGFFFTICLYGDSPQLLWFQIEF